MKLDEAIEFCERLVSQPEMPQSVVVSASELLGWLQELGRLRAEIAFSPYPRRRQRDPRCPGCGSPVVEEGDACHTCKEGTHDPADLQWLNQDAIKEIQRKEQAKKRTHGFVMSTRNRS